MQSATCWAGWRFSGVLIMGLLGCGAFLAAAQAQDKKEITVKKEPFRAETGDGVKLSGDFYFPETNNRKSLPVVILLHSVGPKKEGASRKDFGKLPELLAKQEYAVLAFDFRGYGESKEVTSIAYARAHGRQITKLDAKNFTSLEDYANLASDVIAAKVWLDLQNNLGNCNANNIAVIGAEQGAVVGLLWLANEFIDSDRGRDFAKRKLPDRLEGPAFNPVFWGFNFMQGPMVIPGKEVDVPTKYEGDDVTCMICLSTRPFLGSTDVTGHIKAWLTRPLADQRIMLDKVGVYGIVGDKDTPAHNYWKSANAWLKAPGAKQQSGFKVIANTNLAGTKLLGSEALKTEDVIKEYLDAVFKPATITKLRRDFKDKPSAPEPNPPIFKREALKFFLG